MVWSVLLDYDITKRAGIGDQRSSDQGRIKGGRGVVTPAAFGKKVHLSYFIKPVNYNAKLVFLEKVFLSLSERLKGEVIEDFIGGTPFPSGLDPVHHSMI